MNLSKHFLQMNNQKESRLYFSFLRFYCSVDAMLDLKKIAVDNLMYNFFGDDPCPAAIKRSLEEFGK